MNLKTRSIVTQHTTTTNNKHTSRQQQQAQHKFLKMIEGTLNMNMKPKLIMVRAAFVSLLIASMVAVGSAGTEDNESHRSLVTTVADGVPVPVPVAPPRKLTKNSKASKDDAVSEEMQGLLRLLVFATAVDLNRFSMEQSSFKDAREDAAVENDFAEHACTDCVGLFTSVQQMSPFKKKQFCRTVVYKVAIQIGTIQQGTLTTNESVLLGLLGDFCIELVECPSTPNVCCQSTGVCLNWEPQRRK